MYTFLIFDKKTGEYIGKRETSRRYPEWQEGVDVVKGEALSFQERTRVMSNPEHFKRIKGRKRIAWVRLVDAYCTTDSRICAMIIRRLTVMMMGCGYNR